MPPKTKQNRPKGIVNGKYYPMVSICTPTFNRRPFIPTMFECFKNQTYPKHRMEWIIVDDGTDKISDLIAKSDIPQIKYIELDRRVLLGEKRNIMHNYVTGSIIVYMDDDDYYPPERVSHAVDVLTENKDAMCAGASEIYIYFKHIQKMYQCGPYGPNHATAGTFAFRTEMLKQCKYDNTAALAEEKAFLKNYTIPFAQLDPKKTILVFSHNHNTFDKKKMLDNLHPDFCKESPKTVDMFIRNEYEAPIKKFFMEDIEGLLNNYAPGEPSMKPAVIKEIKRIEEERKVEAAKMNANNGAQLMMSTPDGKQVQLTLQDAVNIMQNQQNQLQLLNKELQEKTVIIDRLQKQLFAKTSNPSPIISTNPVVSSKSLNPQINSYVNNKSKPEVKVPSNIGD